MLINTSYSTTTAGRPLQMRSLPRQIERVLLSREGTAAARVVVAIPRLTWKVGRKQHRWETAAARSRMLPAGASATERETNLDRGCFQQGRRRRREKQIWMGFPWFVRGKNERNLGTMMARRVLCGRRWTCAGDGGAESEVCMSRVSRARSQTEIGSGHRISYFVTGYRE